VVDENVTHHFHSIPQQKFNAASMMFEAPINPYVTSGRQVFKEKFQQNTFFGQQI
jgi:hypothetical protein